MSYPCHLWRHRPPPRCSLLSGSCRATRSPFSLPSSRPNGPVSLSHSLTPVFWPFSSFFALLGARSGHSVPFLQRQPSTAPGPLCLLIPPMPLADRPTRPQRLVPAAPRASPGPYPDRVIHCGGGAARLPLRQAPQEGRAQPHHLVQAAPRAALHPPILPGGRPGRHFPPPPNRKCRPGSTTHRSPAPSLSRPRPGVGWRHGGGAGGLPLPPLRSLLPAGEAPRGGREGRQAGARSGAARR